MCITQSSLLLQHRLGRETSIPDWNLAFTNLPTNSYFFFKHLYMVVQLLGRLCDWLIDVLKMSKTWWEKNKVSELMKFVFAVLNLLLLWLWLQCGVKEALGCAQFWLSPAGLSHCPFPPVSFFYLLIPVFLYTCYCGSCDQKIPGIFRAFSSVCSVLSCQQSVFSGLSLMLNQETFRLLFQHELYLISVLCMSLVSLSSVVNCQWHH